MSAAAGADCCVGGSAVIVDLRFGAVNGYHFGAREGRGAGIDSPFAYDAVELELKSLVCR